MPLTTELVGIKLPPGQASLIGFAQAEGITAAGTTITDATALTSNFNVVETTSSSTGVKLPAIAPGQNNQIFVLNMGSNTLKVYSANTINGAAGSTGISVVTIEGAMFTRNNAGTGWWYVPLGT